MSYIDKFRQQESFLRDKWSRKLPRDYYWLVHDVTSLLGFSWDLTKEIAPGVYALLSAAGVWHYSWVQQRPFLETVEGCVIAAEILIRSLEPMITHPGTTTKKLTISGS